MKKRLQQSSARYAVLIFILITVFTYLARKSFYDYYLTRDVGNVSSLLVSQTFFVSLFWASSLSLALLFYLTVKRRIKLALVIIWALAFLVNIVFWFANLKFVYFAGVEINPFLTSQAEGSGGMIINVIKGPLVFIVVFYALAVGVLLRWLVLCLKKTRRNVWLFSLLSLVGLAVLPWTPFKNFQEYIVPSNFLAYYYGPTPSGSSASEEGNLGFIQKLKRFGIEYNFNRPDVLYHERVYDPAQAPVMDSELIRSKPNILIVLLESFSNDVTSIYNPNLPGLTPNLEKMANHPNTTIFRNYYNAATPTITGLIAQLCSFIPPTGNEEMKKGGLLVEHQLLCLPEILKKNGYNDIFYLHAVEKSFANKDKILQNAGLDYDRIYGKDEITSLVKEFQLQNSVGLKPLSWGYSDHQLYPVFEKLIESTTQKPFLGMMTTIDTHIPYVNSKDIIPYPNPRANTGLNAFYTADDAFGKFWDYFLESDLKNNTILIAVADHAAFPALYTDMKDLFDGAKNKTFFDKTIFMVYIPDSTLPKYVDTLSSSIDLTPTLLHVLGINPPNFFEGHSIFFDRELYPNVLGVNEFTLYINQLDGNGERKISYDDPRFMAKNKNKDEESELFTLTDFLSYYEWKRQVIKQGRFWKKDLKDTAFLALAEPRLIAHAGGGAQGLAYTNSLEALNENYARDFRYFEIDLSWTLDDKLVLIHDWEQTYKNLFNRADGPPYSLFFKNLKMNQGLTQMTFDDFYLWLKEHRDAKIITDIKERNIEALRQIAQTDYRDYFIVQVYSEDEIKAAEELGYKNIILTLYRVEYDKERVLDIARKYDLFAITMDSIKAVKDELLKELDKMKVTVLLHTINNQKELATLAEQGADGFYTDFISPKK